MKLAITLIAIALLICARAAYVICCELRGFDDIHP